LGRIRTRVTSREVAAAAGVSPATVSLVVRESPLVKASTRERVQEVIARLGYRSHAAAAALRSARSRTLGYLVPEMIDPAQDVFRHQLLSAMTTRAHASDYYVLVDTFVQSTRALPLVTGGRIDGILADFFVPDAVLADLIARDIPVVLVGRDSDTKGVSWVKADETDGAREATRHLLGQGHRRIGLIAAGEEGNNDIVRARLDGFRQALAEAGVPIMPEFVAHSRDFTFESGCALGHSLLDRRSRPSALFVFNETLAAGVLKAARQLHIRVPEDLAIATTEDSPWVGYIWPELTAVHVPMRDVGTRATEMLLALLDDPSSAPLHEILPTTLVIRASSEPALAQH